MKQPVEVLTSVSRKESDASRVDLNVYREPDADDDGCDQHEGIDRVVREAERKRDGDRDHKLDSHGDDGRAVHRMQPQQRLAPDRVTSFLGPSDR